MGITMYDEIRKDLIDKNPEIPRARIPLWGQAVQELLRETSDTEDPLPLSWLQERTKIHTKTLHNIVKGRIKNPDSDKLVRIAEAFRISFPELAARAVGNHPSTFFKCGFYERGFIDYPQHGFSIQLFTPPGITARDFTMARMKIAPLKELRRWKFRTNSKVCFYVDEGTIEFIYNEKKRLIKPNESVYFDASIPHKFRNLDSIEAKIFIVSYPAIF